MLRPVFILILILTTIAVGCSGSRSPVNPEHMPDPTQVESNDFSTYSPATHGYMLGMWDVYIDPGCNSVDIVPLRGLEVTVNVTKFVHGPPTHLAFKDMVIDFQTDYVDLSIDFGFQHPVTGLDQFTLFDVMGVFLGGGSDTFPGQGNLSIPGETDQRLLNPDGYTRWFNAPEFGEAGIQSPILGYYPAPGGTPGFIPPAVLNPYKYYADGLDEYGEVFGFLESNPDGRGGFGASSTNYRRLDLRFPNDTILNFQYAFIAHWEPGVDHPEPPSVLEDFPISANTDEAVAVEITDYSNAYYSGDGEFGGDVMFDVEVWDWFSYCETSGVMDEYEIRCYSDAWSGAYEVNMAPIEQADHRCKYPVDIPVEFLESDLDLHVWIEISYPDLDYSNAFGIENDASGLLTSYYKVEVKISPVRPGGWVQVWGDIHDETCNAAGVDKFGNIYVGGLYHNTVDFDPGSGVDEHTAYNNIEDAFLCKYKPNGDFIWARTWGGEYTDQVLNLDFDDIGNVYVCGFYSKTVDFDPGPGVVEYTAVGDEDSFVSKFDSDGNFEWALAWGALLKDYVKGIAVGSGFIYATGFFDYTIDCDPGSGLAEHESNGHSDCYLIKFTTDGSYLDSITWGGSGHDSSYDVKVDELLNVYCTGFFEDTVDFDPGPNSDYYTSVGETDAHLTKFDSNLNFNWALTWGGAGDDYSRLLHVTTGGDITCSGQFTENVDFDPGPGIDEKTSMGERDAFLSRFNNYGDFIWSRTWGGPGRDICFDLSTNDTGNIYVIGSFEETADLDPGAGIEEHTAVDMLDSYISKLDAVGNLIWVKTLGGLSNQNVHGIATGLDGSIYVAGDFHQTVDFAPTGAPCFEESDIYSVGWSHNDAFILKYLPDGCW